MLSTIWVSSVTTLRKMAEPSLTPIPLATVGDAANQPEAERAWLTAVAQQKLVEAVEVDGCPAEQLV